MNKFGHALKLGTLFFLLLTIFTTKAWGQYSYTNESLIKVVEELQKKTSYRFLYREAMISDVTVTFQADDQTLFKELKTNLQFTSIDFKVDSVRKQVVIYRSKEAKPGKKVHISGQVIDAESGERLPFATIFWEIEDELKGVSSNEAGAFNFNYVFRQPTLKIKASYVGYATETVEVNIQKNASIRDLNFRLQSTAIDGNEIIVTGTNYFSDIDTTLQQSVKIGTFSPLGETNSIRALQQLPTVSINTALENGINVRGSSSDGFQVLLDGITIYNQSHLFGLLDSFNADALQTSGLFYDITPVEYQAPPGGTLSLFTRTGSLNEFGGSAGVSNSTYRLTLEGPFKKGKSSWLISGRNSLLNAAGFLNNSDLVEFGLNVNRPREVLSPNFTELGSRVLDPNESSARFFDLHGKIYVEGNDGGRLIISGYYGQDDTENSADRLFRTFASGLGTRLESRPVSTINQWSNGATSIQYQVPVSSNVYSHTTSAISIYKTDYSQDDFTYNRVNPSSNSFQTFTFPFENKSILNEIKAEQRFDISTSSLLWTLGTSYQYYQGEYFESSFDRPGFFIQTSSHKVDAYAQFDVTSLSKLDLFAGTRVHYYSDGNFIKWSPRIKAKLFPNSPVSIGAGYSKNYQFLNEVSLSNVVSSEVWVLASEEQPPASVDYFSAGIYTKPFPNTHFQIEGYIKDYENVRLHEINTFSLSNTFSSLPWFAGNNGRSEGIEFFLKNQFKKFSISQSFVVARSVLQNPLLNEGESFFVDWDRTYTYTSMLEFQPISDLSFFFSWIYASGTPNQLAVFGPANDRRLDDYTRADLSIKYNRSVSFGQLETSFSIYNLFDQNNPWYRELSFVIDQSGPRNRFRTVPVEIFDLGFQPSFNISVSF